MNNSKDVGLCKPNTPYIAYELKKIQCIVCTYIDLLLLETHAHMTQLIILQYYVFENYVKLAISAIYLNISTTIGKFLQLYKIIAICFM